MTALRVIWLASLLLSVAAVLVMMVLVVVRLWTNRQRAKRLTARRQLAPLLLAGEPVTAAQLRRVPDSVIADLSLDLIRLVRGAERDAFVAHATALGVPERLSRRMRSGAARKRAAALEGLAQFDDPVSLAALHRALDDPSPDIRLSAAQALVGKGERFDAVALAARLGLGAEQSPRTMVNLFRAIARVDGDQVKALVSHPGQNLDVRIAAIEALADTGDYSLVPLIARLALEADDASEELPRYLHALGKLGHPSGAVAIRAGLDSQSMAARAAAARSAGRIALHDSADRLTQLLNDREWWVRFRAAEALIGLGEPGAARLRMAAAHGYGPAREAAGTMLAEHGLAEHGLAP